jgi:hypothetical protein
VIAFRFFSRSEHRQGWLCVNQLGCGTSVNLTVRDGLLDTLLDIGAYQSRQMVLGGSQIDPEPQFFKEGENELTIDN